MKNRLVLTAFLLMGLALFNFTFVNLYAPMVSSDQAVAQLEDSDSSWQEMQAFEKLKSVIDTSVFVTLLLGVSLIWIPFLKGKHVKSSLPMIMIMIAMCILLSATTGCRKPYDEAEYKSVLGSQTAVVIPLEGDTSAQGSLQSSEYLKKHMVAEKRIRVPHRWHQTGRRSWSGKWIPTVRVILVDRAPVPREWTADVGSGTSDRDQAIWVESKDSVGFSIGFNAVAYIEEGDDTATFLYRYPSSDLATIMDTEIRAMIQSEASMACAEHDMDLLRSKKTEIIKSIREVVIPFFAKRGITITTIGMFGGYSYENKLIQSAIDETVVAQQQKVIASAVFDAQQKKNDTIELEAKAIKNRELTIAEGEAGRIERVAAAAAKAADNPLFLRLRELEVQEKYYDKWDGVQPRWLMTGGESPSLIVDGNALMGAVN